jgi:16S rRNA (cytosine1402-N4)-methyltransferase
LDRGRKTEHADKATAGASFSSLVGSFANDLNLCVGCMKCTGLVGGFANNLNLSVGRIKCTGHVRGRFTHPTRFIRVMSSWYGSPNAEVAMDFAEQGPEPRHVAALPAEVIHYLAPAPGEVWVDGTTGGGSHARLLLDRLGPGGRLICIDQDRTMLEQARRRLQGNVSFWQANFDQLPDILQQAGLERVDGFLADLGFSSDQLEDPQRGLSFAREGPLDMRLDRETGTTAANLLRQLSERELADVFWKYGEERHSFRIARRIVAVRSEEPITTTTQLADLVRRCVPRPKHPGAIDPATRVFQALRIAVNDELGALERLLAALPSCIPAGGRAGLISFHSLEDRLVKRAFRNRDTWEEITRKPVQAGDDEIQANPRARSAKLRVARRL